MTQTVSRTGQTEEHYTCLRGEECGQMDGFAITISRAACIACWRAI